MSGSPEVFDPYLHWLGIDAAARPVNHYSLLGLPFFEADPAKISAAADERMRHIRQFQAGPRGAFTQKILNELARAKICLLNPVSKPAYDQALHQLLYPPPVTPSATAAPPPPRRRLEDIMPPGWDGSSLPMHAAVPLPPVYLPPSAYGQQQPAYSPQPAATELPESSQPKNTQSIAMVAGLGGAIVLIGVLGVLLIMRMMYPSATDIDLKTGTSSTAEVEQPLPAVAPMPAAGYRARCGIARDGKARAHASACRRTTSRSNCGVARRFRRIESHTRNCAGRRRLGARSRRHG